MRRILFLLGLLVTIVSFSTACADDAGSPIDGEDVTGGDTEFEADTTGESDTEDEVEDSIYREDYSEPYADAICGRIFSCCMFRDRARAGTLLGASEEFDTEEECRRVIADAVDAELAEGVVGESLVNGRQVYRADKIDACLSEIETAACGGGLLSEDATPSCGQVFEAQVDDEGDCAADEDCREGTCYGEELDDDGTITELGTCRSPTRRDVGDECSYSVEDEQLVWNDNCAHGNYCDFEMHICKKKVELGGACQKNRDCVQGAYCDETCKVRNTLGESCTPHSCDGQTYCDIPDFGESGVARCEARKAVGEVCDEDSDEHECKPGGSCSGRCRDHRNATQVCVGIF